MRLFLAAIWAAKSAVIGPVKLSMLVIATSVGLVVDKRQHMQQVQLTHEVKGGTLPTCCRGCGVTRRSGFDSCAG